MFKVVVFVLIFIVGVFSFLLYRNLNGKYIQVEGSGTVKRQPNEASVIVGLRTDKIADTEIANGLENNEYSFLQIIDGIKKIVPNAEIETRTYAISPNDPNVADNMYTIYNSATITVRGAENLSLLSNIIYTAVKKGSNSISNIEYRLGEPELQKAKEASQELALQNARSNAQVYAKKINKKLGSVDQIVNNSDAHRGQSFSVTIQNLQNFLLHVPKDIEVTTNIVVLYEID